uniref:Si:ch211-1a19.2 n=1 Tax=Esox lucius TaxID=8010 RepID=A0A3P9A0K4_ESOLU
MNRAGGLHLTLLLLRCVYGGNPGMVFSKGIRLFVEGFDRSGPSVLILFSFRSDRDGSHTPTLVCVLSGLDSQLVDVLWWINDTELTEETSAVRSSWGSDGRYTATGLWSVSAKDWNPDNDYWCGTRQDGRIYRNGTQPSLCRDFA